MKNQTHLYRLWQRLIATALFVTIGISTAQAASPFQTGDFVIISELGGIEVQKNEITYAQWDALKVYLPATNKTPWEAQDCFRRDSLVFGFGPNYPAACISFDDAEAYIRVLNAIDMNFNYRLPTIDEQKVLVDMTRRSIIVMSNGEYEYTEELGLRYAWHLPISGNHAHEVCTKEPLFGLCDILGNVTEWTVTEDRGRRMYHQGAWNIRGGVVYVCQGCSKYSRLPYHRIDSMGFRLVRTAKGNWGN